MKHLRLLAAIPLVALVAVLAGCSGATKQPVDVTAFTGTMVATVQCNKGDSGYYYWRYREVDPGVQTDATQASGVVTDTLSKWVNLPHQDFGSAASPVCTNGAVGPVDIQQPLGGIPGAVIGRTVYQLKSDTHYAYELCGHWSQAQPAGAETCMDVNHVGHGPNDADQYSDVTKVDANVDPFVSGQWGEIHTKEGALPNGQPCDGCVWGPGKAQVTDAAGNVYAWPIAKPPCVTVPPAGACYDPAADPDSGDHFSSYEGEAYVPGCPQTGACAAGPGGHGIGTGWYCGWAGENKYTVTQAFPVFKSTINPVHMCWGTGANRGRFNNVDQPVTNGHITLWGTGLGWDSWRVAGSIGPLVQNGKVWWKRVVEFHACTPAPWKVGFCAKVTTNWQIIQKTTCWVNNNDILRCKGPHYLNVVF